MFAPKKTKYRKHQKGPWPEGVETKSTKLAFGKYGIKAVEAGILKDKHLETARAAIVRILKGKGKFWIRIFPHQPYTSKGVEFSMGAGKGDVVGYLAKTKGGRILIELDGIAEKTAIKILETLTHKLPIKVKLIKQP